MTEFFPMELLSDADEKRAVDILGSYVRLYQMPDLVIAPDGEPYLYRWHLIPRSAAANVYFHIQVADDPERPLHDHPWHNQSVILSGGYDELEVTAAYRAGAQPMMARRGVGDTIQRKAEWGHRLLMGRDQPYTMTIFSTGPKVRDWGFWYPEGWVSHKEVCQLDGNKSVHVKEKME